MEWAVKKEDFPAFLEGLKAAHRLYGPVRRGGEVCYGEVENAQDLDLVASNSLLSPKGLFLPQSEKMFESNLEPTSEDRNVLKEIRREPVKRVIVGIRPCDAKALALVDANFITPQYVDPWWKETRENSILVGQGCLSPCSTCFCFALGGGPFEETGLDVLLIDVGPAFVAKTITKKGETLLQGLGGCEEAPPEMLQRAVEIAQQASEKMATEMNTFPISTLKDLDTAVLYEAPFWEEVQDACINCGICTYLCPTCWCFDIQDETCGPRAIRMRNWDSCMFPLFTLHASGHNPRGTKEHRVRQRFMHKMKYYLDKYDQGVACVGCGRCVQHCPVNIDIRDVTKRMCQTEET